MNKPVQNTLSGRGQSQQRRLIFDPAVVLSLVLIGIISFAALIVLSGYSGDFRKQSSEKSTANSSSAIGFAGYVQLLKSMEYEVSIKSRITQKQRRWKSYPLRVYTLTRTNQSEGLKAIPKDAAHLIILPKWRTVPNVKKRGWVHKPSGAQLLSARRLSALLSDADMDLDIAQIGLNDSDATYEFKFAALQPYESENETDEALVYNYDTYTTESRIDQLQYFDIDTAPKEAEIILKADEQIVLIKLAGTQTYILSEPDLLNTHGIATRKRARLAVNILDIIVDYEDLKPQAVDFDLSVHGGASGANIIKVMTQPPFLAATLCLLAAGGIIAWQAFSRFGDPKMRAPDFAQGPVSLAKSAAEFMNVSNRVHHMAPDYAQLTRQQVIRKLGLIGQSQDQIDRAIRAREIQRKISPNFAALTAALHPLTSPETDSEAASANNAETSPPQTGNLKIPDLTEYARAMSRWKEEMIS